MYEGHTVGVVVPAYNEEGFVGEVIDTVPGYVDRIYAIDDRSTDGTWAEIRRHADRRNRGGSPGSRDGEGGVQEDGESGAREDGESGARDGSGDRDADERPVTEEGAVTDGGDSPTVVALRNEENRGVGGTIVRGYRHAREDGIDVTAVMAGDGQMDPDRLASVLDPVVDGEAAYAKGNRLYGADRSSMSRWRLFGNLLLSYLTKVASGYWRLMDPQNGYTAISLTALERLDLEALYPRYGFSNDMLVALNAHGFRVADVSMSAVYGDERSHISYRSFVPALSWLLLRRFLRRLAVRYLLRDFHPLVFVYALGVAGLAVALGVLVRAVGSRDRSVAAPLAFLWLSALATLAAMSVDRAENEELVVSVE